MRPFAVTTEIARFRAECSGTTDWDTYFELSKRVRAWSAQQQWNTLLSILLNFNDEQSDRIAGFLLIELEPKPIEPLPELLTQIARSRWYASNRELPFYLAVAFGKYQVLSAIEASLATGALTQDQRTTLEGLRYWISMPVSFLSDRLHYFEWQAAIEAGNG